MTLHHLLNGHTRLTKADARIMLCGPRIWPWSRKVTVWLQRDRDCLWEFVDDVDALIDWVGALR